MFIYTLPIIVGSVGARFVPTQFLPGYAFVVLGALLAIALMDLMLARGLARAAS